MYYANKNHKNDPQEEEEEKKKQVSELALGLGLFKQGDHVDLDVALEDLACSVALEGLVAEVDEDGDLEASELARKELLDVLLGGLAPVVGLDLHGSSNLLTQHLVR